MLAQLPSTSTHALINVRESFKGSWTVPISAFTSLSRHFHVTFTSRRRRTDEAWRDVDVDLRAHCKTTVTTALRAICESSNVCVCVCVSSIKNIELLLYYTIYTIYYMELVMVMRMMVVVVVVRQW